MRRTIVIQSALDKGVSGASQKTFPDKFGPFLTSPGSFEVARLVKKRRNFDLNLSFIHVTFDQTEKMSFSCVKIFFIGRVML